MQKRNLGKVISKSQPSGLGSMGHELGYGPPCEKQAMIAVIPRLRNGVNLLHTAKSTSIRELGTRGRGPRSFRGQVKIATSWVQDRAERGAPRAWTACPPNQGTSRRHRSSYSKPMSLILSISTALMRTCHRVRAGA